MVKRSIQLLCEFCRNSCDKCISTMNRGTIHKNVKRSVLDHEGIRKTEHKFIIKVGSGEYKVPINQDIYRKNLEYYSGMGIYPDDISREKALLISGYRVIKRRDYDDLYRF